MMSFRRRDLDRRDKLVAIEYQEGLLRDLGKLPAMAGISMLEAGTLLHYISSKSLLALPGK